MSAIKDGSYTVRLKGKDYRLLFTLNAIDEIQDKFGGYDKLAEVFNQENKDWVKNTKYLLTLLINEGILEENENAETLTEKQVGRMVHTGNLLEVQKAIFASFVTGTTGDKKPDGDTEEIGDTGDTEEDIDEAGEKEAGQEK